MSIDFIRKECHPPLSLSLYLRIHLSSIPSPMFAPLHLRHIVVLFIHFLVEYHQSQNVKYSVTFCWPKQPTTHTHTIFFLNVDMFCFISNPINRFEAYKNNTNSTISSSIDWRDDLFYWIVCFPLLVITTTLARLLVSWFFSYFCHG